MIVKNRWIIKGAVVLFLLYLFGVAQAEQGKEEDKAVVVLKEVQGEVSALTSNFISIIYERDKEKGIDYEIALPIDENMRLVHKRSLKQIQLGDIVRVKYKEKRKECEEVGEDGTLKRKTKVIERKAAVITFVRPKRPEIGIKGLRTR